MLAPASVEDCFYTAIEAVNIARKYNVPVFILSDQAIATRIEAFAKPESRKGLPGYHARISRRSRITSPTICPRRMVLRRALCPARGS